MSMTIHTSQKLYEALRGIIADLPAPESVVEFDLRLNARELPEVTVKLWVLDAAKQHVIEGDAIKTELKRFKLVPIEETDVNAPTTP